MIWLKLVVLTLACLQGAWLAFDGGKAFLTGDYVTPRSGPYAGELGPWSKVVASIGLEPRGVAVKSLHLALGVAWFAGMLLFVGRPAIGWWLLLGCSVGSLWYLPIGTVLSLVEIGLLSTPSLRAISTY